MKRFLAVLLAGMLLFGTVTINSVTAAADPTFSATDAQGKLGDEISVDINISNNSGIIAFRLYVHYDPTVLELTGATPKDYASTTFGPMTDPFTLVWDESLSPNDTTNGTIAQLTFTIKEDAKVGDTDIEITYNPDDVFDQNFDNVHFETVEGTISVSCAEHTYGDLIPEVPAQCGVEGKRAYYECSACHKLFDVNKTEVTATELVIPALDHVAGADWQADADNHWKICVNDGCGQVIDGTTSLHDFKWVVDTPATEDAPGVQHEECRVCTYKRNENTEIPQLPHVHTGITHHEAVAATCHSTGTVEYWTCSSDKCAGKYYGDADCTTELVSITTPIDSDNHAGGTEVRDKIEATCGKDGYTGDTYCLGCDVKLSDGTTIPATGNHTDDNGQWEADGTNHWHTCGVCEATFDKVSHTGGEATCSAEANCAVCGAEYGELDPTNHKNTEIRDAEEATCGADGYTGDTWCKDCKTMIAEGEIIPATGEHVDADGKWETDGTNHWHACSCGAVMDKAAHEGGEATCSAKANCAVCGAEYGELDPANHKNTEIRDAVAATEEKEGYTGDTWCKDCKTMIAEGTIIPKLDHTHDMVKTEAKPATHEEDGNIEYYTCSKCGKKYNDAVGTRELTDADILLKATGHTYGEEWKSDADGHWHECDCGARADEAAHTLEVRNAKEATETEKGYTGDKVCSVCGYVAEKGEEIPAKEKIPQTGGNGTPILLAALIGIGGMLSAVVLVAGKKRKAHK